MASEWSAKLNLLSPPRLAYSGFVSGRTWRLEEIWPDIRKTVIYDALLEHGLDVADLPVQERFVGGGAMATFLVPADEIPLGGLIGVDAQVLRTEYPAPLNESSYIGLVHELAHIYQAFTGELASPDIWIDAHHERDAIRWSGRQAKAMGWSKEELDRMLRERYRSGGWHGKELETIAEQGQVGYTIHPKQTTIPFVRRRSPVRVRSHRRQR